MECMGKQFDPYKHEVMMVRETDDLPDNLVLEILDKGYHFNDNVLRPAKVVVSRNSNLNKKNENKMKIKNTQKE